MVDDVERYKLRKEGVKAVITWLRIREQHGREYPDSLHIFEIDLEHSALVDRLCRGLPVLEEPPPVSYSYPNYRLADTGEYHPRDVWEPKDKIKKTLDKEYNCKTIIIDQEVWKIVNQLNEHEYIITYRTNRLFEDPVWSNTHWHLKQTSDQKWIVRKWDTTSEK